MQISRNRGLNPLISCYVYWRLKFCSEGNCLDNRVYWKVAYCFTVRNFLIWTPAFIHIASRPDNYGPLMFEIFEKNNATHWKVKKLRIALKATITRKQTTESTKRTSSFADLRMNFVETSEQNSIAFVFPDLLFSPQKTIYLSHSRKDKTAEVPAKSWSFLVALVYQLKDTMTITEDSTACLRI